MSRIGDVNPYLDPNIISETIMKDQYGDNKVNVYTIKDSGQRQEFKGGMVRDTVEGKVNWLLIRNGPMYRRWAEHLTKGEIKYPDHELGKANWMRADGLEEYIRFRRSATNHMEDWLAGKRDEDHAAAIMFNVNGAEYVRNKMLVNGTWRAEYENLHCKQL